MSIRSILWTIAALSIVGLVTASVLTAREKPKGAAAAEQKAEEEDDGGCCGNAEIMVIRPAVETLGRSGARVKVIGFVGDSSKYNDVIAMLRRLAGQNADALRVTLYSESTMRAQQEMKRLGRTGPGFFVSDHKCFTLRDPNGATWQVLFEGDPTKDYNASDLKTVIVQAMAGTAQPAKAPPPPPAGQTAGAARGASKPPGKAG